MTIQNTDINNVMKLSVNHDMLVLVQAMLAQSARSRGPIVSLQEALSQFSGK